MRTTVMLFVMLNFFALASAQKPEKKEYNLLIGTYSNEDKTNGIHVFSFDTQSGDYSERSKNTDVANASYLAVSSDSKNVYAVSEVSDGSVNAFSFDSKTGALALLNSVPAAGDHPCYISVDDRKKNVFVGTYSSGTLSAIPVKEDGSLGPDIQTITQHGQSVNKERQDKSHVHAVVLSPDNGYLFVPDLGTDKVNAYRVDATRPQPLTPAGETIVKPGSGPRHLTFHPNGKFAYLVQELVAAVTAFDYKDGKLQEKQTITLLAPDYKGAVGAADIHVSPDGKFLYGSNRGDANEITIYSIDNKGKLTYVGRQSTLGKTPRNFVIDPTGNFLLAANQNSNDIFLFKRDKKTGLLTDTGKKITIDKPVCLKFAAVD